MRIVKLDESAYLPDYVIEGFKKLGDFKKYDDRPDQEEAIRRLRDADIAIVEWTSITREMLEKAKGLKYLVVALTGYEFVDVKAARELNIPVSNIPAYSGQSVAEHAFAMLLGMIRKIIQADADAKAGKRDYFAHYFSMELCGKTLGIIGLGDIGTKVAKIGTGFGMTVIANSRKPKNKSGIVDADLEEVLQKSDVVVLSVDFNDSTKNLLDKQKLDLLKPSAYFVSIVPPGIVDENVLADLLTNKKLAGAALDIPMEHSPLEKVSYSLLTPCIAWYTQDSLDRLAQTMLANVEKYIEGEPVNLVN